MAGEILKKRREELNLNIRDIADHLKIKAEYLHSIEDGLFERLPVAVYTKGYIRAYSEYLKIAPEPILQYYTEHLSQPKPTTIMPIASSQKRIPKLFYALTLIAIVVISFLAFIYMPGNRNENPTPVIHRDVAAKPMTAIISAPEINIAKTASMNISAPAKKEHSLDITATELTWILIKFNNANEEILLRPGQSKNWKFSEQASVKIGNAAGVKVIFDDKGMEQLGAPGQVIILNLPQES